MLTLRLDWEGKAPQKTAQVGLGYLQKGLRWIPGYKITIDGEGKAVVALQATLVNELADLHYVTAHLVIGVPRYMAAGDYPYWWNWYNWPYWWHHFNGVGRVTWRLTLEPEKRVDLGYKWNYYWR